MTRLRYQGRLWRVAAREGPLVELEADDNPGERMVRSAVWVKLWTEEVVG